MIQQIKTIKIAFFILMASGMILCFGNCTQKENAAQNLEQEIMRVHDSVMPKMGYVLKLRSTISGLMGTAISSQTRDSLQKISYHLTKSDKRMMEWMHGYSAPDLNADTAMQYLEKQHTLITSVAASIRMSIQEAEDMVKSHPVK